MFNWHIKLKRTKPKGRKARCCSQILQLSKQFSKFPWDYLENQVLLYTRKIRCQPKKSAWDWWYSSSTVCLHQLLNLLLCFLPWLFTAIQFFFTYKLVLSEGRSAANRLWKIPDISNFMCTRSCSQPYLCLPALSCAQVTQQKYLEQGTNVLTSRHWDFGEGIFFLLSPHPCILPSLFLFLHCLNSTKLWRAEALACDSPIHGCLWSHYHLDPWLVTKSV